MKKVWKYPDINESLVEDYIDKYNISEILAKIILSRGIREDEISDFLNPSISKLHDPFMLNDMEKVVKRIIKARDENELVAIYGDYDVDGITSITILYTFLKELGIEVSYYLPDRLEEGYGLNENALKRFKDEGITLLITVDCGISAVEEVNYAVELGIDIIITDHHECGEKLPKAFAIINAKLPNSTYPFYSLAGVGTTFKLISALAIYLNMEDESYLKFIDIVALGTIADIVPLQGENRIIAHYGIKALKETKNEGLIALMKFAKVTQVTSEAVSFALAPRINASGRMADATVAVKLLLSENEAEAFKYAKILDSQNEERQRKEKEIYDAAEQKITEEKLNNRKAIVLANTSWHPGVIGIVASKLMEKYLKPVILFSIDETSNIAKGSGRIPQGVSLYLALSKCNEYLLSFGGHELAAGLSIKVETIERFTQAFEYTISLMETEEFVSEIYIDAVLEEEDATEDTVKQIELLAPFGQKNNVPVFAMRNLKVISISTLKDKHLKFRLKGIKKEYDGIYFKAAKRRDELVVGDKIDIAFNLNINEFMGNKKIQLNIQDFKKSM